MHSIYIYIPKYKTCSVCIVLPPCVIWGLAFWHQTTIWCASPWGRPPLSFPAFLSCLYFFVQGWGLLGFSLCTLFACWCHPWFGSHLYDHLVIFFPYVLYPCLIFFPDYRISLFCCSTRIPGPNDDCGWVSIFCCSTGPCVMCLGGQNAELLIVWTLTNNSKLSKPIWVN